MTHDPTLFCSIKQAYWDKVRNRVEIKMPVDCSLVLRLVPSPWKVYIWTPSLVTWSASSDPLGQARSGINYHQSVSLHWSRFSLSRVPFFKLSPARSLTSMDTSVSVDPSASSHKNRVRILSLPPSTTHAFLRRDLLFIGQGEHSLWQRLQLQALPACHPRHCTRHRSFSLEDRAVRLLSPSQDFEQLSHGANTLVGDQGVMLSGVRSIVAFFVLHSLILSLCLSSTRVRRRGWTWRGHCIAMPTSICWTILCLLWTRKCRSICSTSECVSDRERDWWRRMWFLDRSKDILATRSVFWWRIRCNFCRRQRRFLFWIMYVCVWSDEESEGCV